MIYVIGHKNPDTDSVVSAIVMADYLKKFGKKAKAFRAGKINKETSFALKKAGAKPPFLIKSLSEKKVFLVDHNETSQAGENIEKAEIFGVLDHHKLGGLKTNMPIFFRIEVLGSTCTLIFKLFEEKNIQLTKKQALLLLAGILSDTLKMTSPTTVGEDRRAVKILAKISQTNIDVFSRELFAARSDISGIKLKDIVFGDYKNFKEKNLKFGVGVHETLNPQTLLKKEKEIFSLLKNFKKNEKLDLIFFAIIDILKKKALFFLSGDKEGKIVQKAFQKKVDLKKEQILDLPGIVSRKKQILPLIIKNL